MNSAPCILLVAKSLTFLTLARQYLKHTNAHIVDATSYETALEACRSHTPKLIYLAANLPEPGGIECCRRIKSERDLGHIPIILMADAADGDPITLSRRSNCDAVIGMPPLKQNLLAIGRSFLAEFREQRFSCRLPARLSMKDQLEECRCVDISSNGVFLAHQQPPSLGCTVEVELQLKRSHEMGPRITCRGQVVWVNTETEPLKPGHPPGFGIRFTDLSSRAAAVLNGFLRTLDYPAPRLAATDGPQSLS